MTPFGGVHEDEKNGRTKEAFVLQVARFGQWNRHFRVAIPRRRDRFVRRLGEIPAG